MGKQADGQIDTRAGRRMGRRGLVGLSRTVRGGTQWWRGAKGRGFGRGFGRGILCSQMLFSSSQGGLLVDSCSCRPPSVGRTRSGGAPWAAVPAVVPLFGRQRQAADGGRARRDQRSNAQRLHSESSRAHRR